MTQPEPVITQYTVCALPDTSLDWSLFAVTVERIAGIKDDRRWHVRWRGRTLNDHGIWDHDDASEGWTFAWSSRHCFPLEQALDLARTASVSLPVAEDYLAERNMP